VGDPFALCKTNTSNHGTQETGVDNGTSIPSCQQGRSSEPQKNRRVAQDRRQRIYINTVGLFRLWLLVVERSRRNKRSCATTGIWARDKTEGSSVYKRPGRPASFVKICRSDRSNNLPTAWLGLVIKSLRYKKPGGRRCRR
jgi:hypothetical protein